MGTFSRPESEIKELIEEYRSRINEISMTDFAKEKGIDRTTFSGTWLKRFAPELRPGHAASSTPRTPKQQTPKAEDLEGEIKSLEAIQVNHQAKPKAQPKPKNKDLPAVFFRCDKDLFDLIRGAATFKTKGNIKAFIEMAIEDYLKRNPALTEQAREFINLMKKNNIY